MRTGLVITLLLNLSALATADDIPSTGPRNGELDSFDVMMLDFMAEHDVPGAALAVGRGGRVLYSRGFGWSDAARTTPVEPDALFRIASVSKPITAVAVMQLVEQGKLELDANPFEVVGRGDALEAPEADPRLRDVTVQHLLHHTGGYDRSATFDPMFAYGQIATAMGVPSPPDHDAIIGYMLQRKLDFDPGTKYVYSNYGYCVLGRVIEAVSGMTYEAYVQKHVLEPVGATRMRIGLSLPGHRAEGEVEYVDRRGRESTAVTAPDKTVPRPYVIHHEVMDAHGAWIASASDLVRFAMALDPSSMTRILDADTVEQMFAPPPPPVSRDDDGAIRASYYGLGWLVQPVGGGRNTWHNGLINGTSTILVRRHDGLTWAVLFNGDSNGDGKHYASLIDSLVHRAADEVRWEHVDL